MIRQFHFGSRRKRTSVKSKSDSPLILAIDTATRTGGIAIARGEKMLACREGDESVSHSINLIEMIQSTMQEAGVSLPEVELFAVTVGPGSFTGLRIGLATVKAFAATTGREIVGVSTLAAIAYAAGESDRCVALLPAGRGEVFAQMFLVNNGSAVSLDEAAHLTPKETWQRYGEKIDLCWAGEGVTKIQQYLEAFDARLLARLNGTLPGDTHPGFSIGLAASVAALALTAYREGKSVDAGELRAVYVRPSDAEINQEWQQQKSQPSVPQ